MSKILEGMARAAYRAQYGAEFDSLRDGVREQFMKAAILWLADNVSDEMVWAYLSCKPTNPRNLYNAIRESISAALRVAAGGGE